MEIHFQFKIKTLWLRKCWLAVNASMIKQTVEVRERIWECICMAELISNSNSSVVSLIIYKASGLEELWDFWLNKVPQFGYKLGIRYCLHVVL